jgi:hypothetical protein
MHFFGRNHILPPLGFENTLIMQSYNSWATGPVKSRSILEYYFAYSYLRFGTCYVDENTAIRSSEKLYPNS